MERATAHRCPQERCSIAAPPSSSSCATLSCNTRMQCFALFALGMQCAWRRPHAAASGLASRGADCLARQRRAPKLAAVRLLPLEPPEQVELKHVSFQDVLWIHKRWGMGYGSTSDHRSVELERACAYVGPDGRPPRQLVMQADGRGPSVALHTMSAAAGLWIHYCLSAGGGHAAAARLSTPMDYSLPCREGHKPPSSAPRSAVQDFPAAGGVVRSDRAPSEAHGHQEDDQDRG